jgi:hypothetical protein
MKFFSRILACLFLTMVVFTSQAQTKTSAAPAIDPGALRILKGMTDYLAAASNFSYHSESEYDVVQESGVKIAFGASRNILVSRPNRLRADVERRDGVRGTIVFDGKNIWAIVPDENVYASAPQPGDLGESLLFAVSELNITAPLAELLAPDFYETATSKLTGALDLGETVVAGVACDHLLFSNDYTDAQMWITKGDKPVLRRIVITYREEPGEPQYRAQFTNWDMSPDDTSGKLKFDPPEGSQRIRFYKPETDAGLVQEKDS